MDDQLDLAGNVTARNKLDIALDVSGLDVVLVGRKVV